MGNSPPHPFVLDHPDQGCILGGFSIYIFIFVIVTRNSLLETVSYLNGIWTIPLYKADLLSNIRTSSMYIYIYYTPYTLGGDC